MVTRTVASFVLVSAAILCVGGCKKETRRRDATVEVAKPSSLEPPQNAGTELTAATVNSPTAIDQMVDVRCARAATCNEIGFRARFDSRAACVERVNMAMQGLLTVNECPGGIDERALTACLDAIKKEPCNGPLNALDLRSCGSGDLCPLRPAPRP